MLVVFQYFINHFHLQFYRVIDEQILEGCTTFLEELLEVSAGKLALDKFLTESQFASVLLSPPVSGDMSSSSLPTHIIKFFIRLFQLGKWILLCMVEERLVDNLSEIDSVISVLQIELIYPLEFNVSTNFTLEKKIFKEPKKILKEPKMIFLGN